MNKQQNKDHGTGTSYADVWKTFTIIGASAFVLNCLADGNMSGYVCMYVGSAQRDSYGGSGLLDTCKGHPSGNCNPTSYPLCLVYDTANGNYCWHSSPSDSCYWTNQLSVPGYEGWHEGDNGQGCNWGYRNGQAGECYCLFDVSKPLTMYLYQCGT